MTTDRKHITHVRFNVDWIYTIRELAEKTGREPDDIFREAIELYEKKNGLVNDEN